MVSPGFHQRLQDLADNITQDQELLKEFEEELRYETNPRIKGRYRREIERQQESVKAYQQEYKQLQQELASQSSIKMQKVEGQLQQMDAKLNLLLSGQVTIYRDIKGMGQDLLNRYDASEQNIISGIIGQLDEKQLVLTQKLLDAVENNHISEQETQQMLDWNNACLPCPLVKLLPLS